MTNQDFAFIFSVEAARTLLTSPDKTRDVPGPVRVVSTDQVQPVAVAPQVIVPTAQVVGPVPGGVPGPVRIVPGPLPAQARVVPVLTGVAGPQVMPVPAQPATVPRPAPEPELASVRDPVPVTAEDIEAGWISRTVVINGCEFTRIGKVYYNSRGRLVIPKLRTGKVVQR